LSDRIEAMAATVEIFAMLRYTTHSGMPYMKGVKLIGIDAEQRATLGGFAEHLLNPENRKHPSFELPGEAREQLERQQKPLSAALRGFHQAQPPPQRGQEEATEPPTKPDPAPPPETEMPPVGIILGYALAHFRNPDTQPGTKADDICFLSPGDKVDI